jgi:hypothetical protein
MGHVANTVTQAHYVAEDTKIELLQNNVVDHVETIIDTWEAPADTRILPGFRLVVNE